MPRDQDSRVVEFTSQMLTRGQTTFRAGIERSVQVFQLHGIRHWFNPKTTIILSYAHMRNSSAAHFALGAGGHGVTWDCKDGSGPSTASAGPGIGLIGNGTGCFTGTSPQAFSLGMTYDF